MCGSWRACSVGAFHLHYSRRWKTAKFPVQVMDTSGRSRDVVGLAAGNENETGIVEF